MVWKPGSKHSVSSSRVIARRNDWNSIGDLHQGPRSMAASRGRIHDRSPINLPKHKKALAERGASIHDAEIVFSRPETFPHFRLDLRHAGNPAIVISGLLAHVAQDLRMRQ